MLAKSRVDIRQGVDLKLLEREHEINGLLNSHAQRLLSIHGAGAEDKATALKEEIGDRESELHEVELAIRKSSPQYSAITQPSHSRCASCKSRYSTTKRCCSKMRWAKSAATCGR
jgi:hypothetical protein